MKDIQLNESGTRHMHISEENLKTIAKYNLFQMITAPEHIGIQSFHRFGNHNKLYLLIVLKGTLTHDFHCIGNRDTFIASSVFCQCTAFNLKIGGRRCRICLRHRKMCQE